MTHRIFSLTAVALMTSATAFAQTINDGLKQIDLDDLDKARSIFQKYTQTNPTDADGFFHFGDVLTLEGKTDSAKLLYTKALEVNPKAATAQIAAGRLALANKDEKAATAAFDKALRAGRKNSDTYRYIASSYGYAKNYAKADEWFKDGLDKDSKNARIYYAMGEMYFAKNDGGNAVSNYELANFYDKTWATPLLKVAKIQRRAKNAEDRMAAIQKAEKANPNQPSVYRDFADAFYDKGDFEKALTNYDKYMNMAGATTDMLIRRINILVFLKRYKEVFATADAILAKNPKKTDVYRAVGYAHSELGDSTKAVDAMQNFLKNAAPDRTTTADYLCLGKNLTKMGNGAEAEKAYESAMKMDTTDYLIPGELAKAAFGAKDYKKAAKYYSMVADRTPKNKLRSQELFNIGYAYYSDGDYVKAEEAFKRQIAFRPDGIGGYEWAARAVMLADPNSEKGLAKPYLEKVIEVGSKDTTKFKEQLKLAYGYLAGLACTAKDAATANANATKLLELNPESDQAKAILAGGCN